MSVKKNSSYKILKSLIKDKSEILKKSKRSRVTAYPTQTTFKTLLLRDGDYFIRFYLMWNNLLSLLTVQSYTEGSRFSMTKLILVDDV